MYANNCVFHCVHKENDNAFSPGANDSFRESGLQITLRLLSSSLGNTVLLHTLFLKYETQIGKTRILDNVFQSNCSSHAKLLTNLRKKSKNSLKFDIGCLCTQPFNYNNNSDLPCSLTINSREPSSFSYC